MEKDETKRDRYALAINGLHIVTCAERGSRPTAAQRLHVALTSEQALMMIGEKILDYNTVRNTKRATMVSIAHDWLLGVDCCEHTHVLARSIPGACVARSSAVELSSLSAHQFHIRSA